jgi:serine protease AprX
MKKQLFFLLLLFSITQLAAQTKYWVFFKEKGKLSQPSLSWAAIENRTNQGITLDERDFPVNSLYLQQLQTQKIKPIRISRWLNGVSAYLTPSQIEYLKKCDFVREISPVATLITTQKDEIVQKMDSLDRYGWQLEMIGADKLHQKGFTGKGVKVALFDDGFVRADTLRGFQHIFKENRLLYTYDFVDNDKNVFENCPVGNPCKHGSWTWSIISGKIENQLLGSAPDAEYMLFRTEKGESETKQEEDNWVVAAELADSLGAQVFSTSLGYSTFDVLSTSYTQAQLDGNTSIITKAADIAASKGIIVVNSAGNEGAHPWRKVLMPADGDSVLAVGSVNKLKVASSFSSHGPSADGRVKPDVMAIGERTFLQEINGQVTAGYGTSFSAPLMAGMMVCLRQAVPNINGYKLCQAVIRSADRYANPDTVYGYGIPNGFNAYLGLLLANVGSSETPFYCVNNPSSHNIYAALINEGTDFEGVLNMIDLSGRSIFETKVKANKGENIFPIELEGNYGQGIYIIRLYSEGDAKRKYQTKVILK